MSKSFQILVIHSLLLVFAQSLSSLDTEKISFNQSQIQYKLNEPKNHSESIEIGVDSKYHQDMVIGYKGTLVFITKIGDNAQNIFDPETLEKESPFTTTIIDENHHVKNITCRLGKPNNEIKVLCNVNFLEKGPYSVRIGNQSFIYRSKYLINVNFYGEKDFTFQQIDTYIPFGKDNEYYNTNLKDYVDDLNIHYGSPLINDTLPEEENATELYIEYEDNQEKKYIGYEGILNFVLDFNDSETNIIYI